MRTYDITLTITEDLVVWPDDPPVEIYQAEGDPVLQLAEKPVGHERDFVGAPEDVTIRQAGLTRSIAMDSARRSI